VCVGIEMASESRVVYINTFCQHQILLKLGVRFFFLKFFLFVLCSVTTYEEFYKLVTKEGHIQQECLRK